MTQASLEQKKQEFRQYLDKNGIVDALTKVLVGLYEEPEKPEKPLEYIKQILTGPANVDVEVLQQENQYLKEKIAELESRIVELTTAKTETVEATNDGSVNIPVVSTETQ